MSSRIKIFIVILLSFCSAYGAELTDYSRISVLTCAPGEFLYERYGHTALRVCDPVLGIDYVYNYGVFDFDTEHFYYKFVRGETMYLLGYTYYRYFIEENRHDHRQVCEQVLNLTLEQRNRVWDALQINLRPENRTYLYNFVFDNCATRPYHLIMDAIGDSIHSDYVGNEGNTYRAFLSHYTGAHSWVDFGINMLFGPRADQPMHGEQRLFLPEELMNYLAVATLSDGTPLIRTQNICTFPTRHTPWYATWYWGGALLLIGFALLSLLDIRRGKCSIWVDSIFICLYIILLALVTFLTFFSIHPLVGFGWRLFILPALHLLGRTVYICAKH